MPPVVSQRSCTVAPLQIVAAPTARAASGGCTATVTRSETSQPFASRAVARYSVVDVGDNRTDAGLVGDVDYEPVRQVAAHITPVPGGVGPMTITMLLGNTLQAARRQ